MLCPHCQEVIDPKIIASHLGKKGGSVKSEAKTEACRKNAKRKRKREK